MESKVSLIDNFLYRCFLYTFNLHPNERYTLLSLYSLPGGTMVKKICLPMQETQILSLGQEDPLEKEMATHFSILAQKIPWTEEPGGL